MEKNEKGPGHAGGCAPPGDPNVLARRARRRREDGMAKGGVTIFTLRKVKVPRGGTEEPPASREDGGQDLKVRGRSGWSSTSPGLSLRPLSSRFQPK